MAQRGGSVVSHVRIGKDIFSPLLPLGSAHVLIAFEPSEAARQLPYISKSGSLIVCDLAVKPIGDATAAKPYDPREMLDYLSAAVPGAVIVDGAKIKERFPKSLNVVLLGAAAESGLFPFDAEALKEVLPELLNERLLEMNQQSFETGRALYNERRNIGNN
jgi:indolepyruvate ferredoxin oxidoreductase beta subunit